MNHFANFNTVVAGFALSVLGINASAWAEGSEKPLEIGPDIVVLIDGATSKDGRYAIGWTLRASSAKGKPVDWSAWDPSSPNDFYDHYDYLDPDSGTTGGRPYELVDVAVDLKKKQLLELPSDTPYWLDKNHGGIDVTWSPAANGVEYAIVNNESRWSTANLWLVTARDSGMRETELTEQLDKEVGRMLKTKRPLTYDSYAIGWGPSSDGTIVFAKSTAKVAFSVGVPKDYDDVVDVSLALDMERGTIDNVTSKTPADNPFKDNPELAKADRELNVIYAKLLGQLIGGGREALKKEQRGWLTDRNNNAENPSLRQADQTRDQSLIESTKARTAELKKRLRE